MKVKGSYRPNAVEYEVLHDGTAVIRLYENIAEYEEPETEDMPGFSGWEFDRYTISRPHTERLRKQVEEETELWLDFARREEIAELSMKVRARRNQLLEETDKTQLVDAPINDENRAAIRVYRQVLRDIPEQAGFPYEIEWPEEPIA